MCTSWVFFFLQIKCSPCLDRVATASGTAEDVADGAQKHADAAEGPTQRPGLEEELQPVPEWRQ